MRRSSFPAAYWWVTGANLALMVGRAVSTFVFPIIAFDLGGVGAASLVATLSSVGAVAGALVSGWIVDSYNRFRVMLLSCALTLLVMLCLSLEFVLVNPHVLALAFAGLAVSAAEAVFGSAELSYLKEILPPSLVEAGVGIQQSRFSLVSMIGPGIGGILLSISMKAPLLVDSALASLAVLGLVAIRRRSTSAHRQRLKLDISSFFAGFTLLFKDGVLLRIAAVATLMNWFAGALILALTLMLRHGGASGTNLSLLPICFGIGGLLGGYAVSLGRSLSSSVLVGAGFGGGCASVFGGAMVVSVSNRTWPVAVFLGIGMFGIVIGNSILTAWIISRVDDSSLGRAMGAMRTLALGTMPLGPGLATLAISVAGWQWAGVWLAALLGIPLLVVVSLTRSMRRARIVHVS